MKYSLEMSVRPQLAQPAAVVRVAQAAERAGFAMLGYTEHPAPSRKWMAHGGHASYDPFAALSFLAGVTSEVGLMAYCAVLPYRNPLLLAKLVSTIDCLSAGRFTLVAGTGYLRSEFSALGKPFEERNDLFDEAIEVVRRVFVDEEFRFEGSDFAARGVAISPPPVQLPHPPLWIGGTSNASLRRAARYGAGWAPFFTSEESSRTVRSAPMPGVVGLAARIEELRRLTEAEGRDPSALSIQVEGALGPMDGPAGPALERVAELGRIGVTHLLLQPAGASLAEACEAVEAFGTRVIAPTA